MEYEKKEKLLLRKINLKQDEISRLKNVTKIMNERYNLNSRKDQNLIIN
jgi:hypothetical protein